MILITFETRDKTCSKIQKALLRLVDFANLIT